MTNKMDVATSAAIPPTVEKFETARVLTLGAAHAVHDMYAGFLAPLLPDFIKNLALSNAQAGLLEVFLRAPSLLQPYFGYLADHISLRYFVILAPTFTALGMSLLGVAPTYAMLALFLLVAGISSASIHTVAPVMVGRLGHARLGRAMGYWMVGGEVGRVVGPLVVAAAVSAFGLAGLPWLTLGGVLASVLLFVLLRDVSGRPPGTRAPLPWRAALRSMGPFMALMGGMIIARSFMSAALTTFLPTFLRSEGADLWLSSSALAVFEAAGVGGTLLGGALSDRLGRQRILWISWIVTPLLMFVFLAAGATWRFPLLLALGFMALSITPVLMALVQESFPQNRALANGFYMALSFVLRSLVTVVVGALADWLGLRGAFTLSAGLALLGAPLLFWLPHHQAAD